MAYKAVRRIVYRVIGNQFINCKIVAGLWFGLRYNSRVARDMAVIWLIKNREICYK